MAYKEFDGLSLGETSQKTILNGEGHKVDLPDSSYVRDAELTRDGMDLILNGPDGELIIHDYFADETPPALVAPDGSTLTPELVQSFARSAPDFAQNQTLADISPVGTVSEVTGQATVTHPDGTTETVTIGTPIYQGDIIETDASGAVNITFIDETNFAVSEDARLAIDEYVYDPQTESGSTNFSVLKGVFVFTSGLIGRDDPDDVHIKTPVGSIGIRGTIIAGNVDTGEITVIEGAIVLTDNSGHEMTLATQFETARFHGSEGIENLGQLEAGEVSEKFFVVSQVSPSLFSSIHDAAAEENDSGQQAPVGEEAPADAPAENAAPADTEDHSDAAVAPDPVAALPAVPPPVQVPTGLMSASGFETTNLNSTLNNTISANTVITTTAPQTFVATDTVSATTNTGPVIPPPPQEERPPVNAGSGAINLPPVHAPEAPPQYFASAEGQSWHYNFNKDFRDDGGQPNLTYQLSAGTINTLNSLVVDGGGPNPDILVAGWSFNSTNGDLQLNFNANFTSTPGLPYSFNIEVEAVDSQGQSSGYRTYAFSAYNANATTMIFTHSADAQVITLGAGYTGQVVGDNNKIFFSDNNDVVTLNNSGGGNTGSNNLLNLGDGTNLVTVNFGARFNTVVGGDNYDLIEIQNGAVRVFGMDGDDDIRIVLGGTSTFTTDVYGGGTAVIDGGHSNFRAGLVLNGFGINTVMGEAGGRGDSLLIQGAGSLNFGLIGGGNTINSIERIDAATSTAGSNLILDYSDILRITDNKDALIINLGANDTLALTGMGGMTRVLDNVAIDDGLQGSPDVKNYDVFTDGHVTLLINATGAAATSGVTMDGVTTTI